MATAADGELNLDATVIARADDLTAAHIEAELVIMQISSGNLYHLNRVAARIWDSLDSPIPLGALVARIEEQFDVPAETCRSDIGALLREFESHGLIRMTPPRA